jgi:hypothetical protein
MDRVSLDGRFVGLPGERLRPGPAVWAAAVAAVVLLPRFREPVVSTPGPFNVYWDAGIWLANSTPDGARVLDLTDWSLYFSRREGSTFAQIREAVDDPSIRWVVALRSQVEGPTTYGPALRKLIGDRPPVAVLRGSDDPGRVQIQIFERAPASQVAAGSPAPTRL